MSDAANLGAGLILTLVAPVGAGRVAPRRCFSGSARPTPEGSSSVWRRLRMGGRWWTRQ